MGKVKDEGGMMKDEFCYGEDFTGETVRVVKEKEVRLYGEAPQSDVKAGVGGVGCFGMRNAEL